MRGLGLREIVALLALAVVGVIAFQFLDPAASEGGVRSTPTRGPAATVTAEVTAPVSTPTPTASPTATPTPLPLRELARPARFRVEVFDDRPTSGHVKVADGAVEGLALSYAGAPFPDLVDDRWSLVASAPVELPEAGRYRFVLVYRGEVTVRVDGEEAARAAGPSEAGRLEVVFSHGGGTALLEIELRDRGGVAEVRWE
ncbi:hypothetical protein [Tepidiforma thermophila]|uniref:PA14 domain-containing protein n=1 Tax=Tepidiforma thermophila (strain KCTC 52669 / CGMCC 1.13589 / G233) TaxID=2761530 RepID=A0A2A9HEG3_TEPT2|nr:hypothetical protein [Tepidiforma thermophila]PFG73490.1 hypothetical protein A9A59_0688 [Tepidiforma thermophila]